MDGPTKKVHCSCLARLGVSAMNRLVMLAAALLLSACAASGSVQLTSASSPAVDSTKSGSVEVSTALADKIDTTDALKRAIVAQIVSKKVFKSVTDGDGVDYSR